MLIQAFEWRNRFVDRSSSQRAVLGTALYEIFEKYFETPSRLTLNTHWK